MSNKLQPFTWYGSKYNWLDYILPKIPNSKRYVEPYGGSATVLLNKQRSEIEVFNDIDGDVINFFRVLRNSPEELVERIDKVPYHEGIFQNMQERIKSDSDIERAVAFFVLTVQSYNSSQNSWAYTTNNPRGGTSMNTSRYQHKIGKLEGVADRLMDVQFFSRDAVEVMELFDYEDCFIYLDPPYPLEVRTNKAYNFEMDAEEHREMAKVAKKTDASVLISTYKSDLYEDMFSDWNRYDCEKKTASTNSNTERVESLYANYDAEKVNSITEEVGVFDY